MTTYTSERGLERLICRALTGSPCLPAEASAQAGDPGAVGRRVKSTSARRL